MKRGISFLLSLSIIFFVSCKFEQTPVGGYKGYFSAWGVPISSANDGKLIINEQSNGYYRVTLSYPGNPDIVVSDLSFSRKSGIYGNNFSCYSSTVEANIDIDVDEYDIYNGHAWAISADYSSDTSALAFSFYGAR